MGIKKVLLCGLGAVGLTYANKLKDVCELKILADSARIEKYKKLPPELNGKKIPLKYITPEQTWDPDLILITTKSNGLESAIEYIKNYVSEKTIIISLINGVTSESQIAEVYGWNNVLHSYFIGHSAVREENKVTQDGVGKIIFGSPHKENAAKVKQLAEFFEAGGIDYEIPKDIIYSLWLKFTLNVFSNQVSAITNMTFGELKNGSVVDFAKGIIAEVAEIAKAEGVKGIENFEKDTLDALSLMTDSGKTSMLQDVLARRKTEVDIFAGEIIRLGELHGIQTPYNQVMHDMIKNLEETF